MRVRSLALTISLSIFVSHGFAADSSFIHNLNQISPVASTVPANGDVNPYGVAVVPTSVGALVANNILVSNFNNVNNLQGTGTTIVQITPSGQLSVFAQIAASAVPGCVGGVGLTTALEVFRSGWVIVGSLPTADGTSATAQAGCLIVLNSQGQPVETFAGNGINGPWDMAALDLGTTGVIFVSNVLNGTVAGGGANVFEGTVLRIVLQMGNSDGGNDDIGMPQIQSTTEIGSGFAERTDPNALVIGPTGLALGLDGTLYVADTLANRIASIPLALVRGDSAGTGNLVAQDRNINGPLGLVLAPNGNLLTVNGGDGNMIEVAPTGRQEAVMNVDVTLTGGGTLFGLAITPDGTGVYFVNDGNNMLYLLH